MGARYVLSQIHHQGYGLTVTRIEGMVTDINPTIVAAATMDAVWKALHFQLSPEVIARIEELVFHSWDA